MGEYLFITEKCWLANLVKSRCCYEQLRFWGLNSGHSDPQEPTTRKNTTMRRQRGHQGGGHHRRDIASYQQFREICILSRTKTFIKSEGYKLLGHALQMTELR
jgi:hypothetical protein